MKTPALLFCLLALPLFVDAQVPNLVSYQGRVAVGTLNFEGTGQFRFALVNAAGTTIYWGNAADTTPADGVPDAAVSLAVSKGLYSVLLGDTSIANMAAIPASVWTNADVRLRVWFNDGVNGNQLLTPDQRLAPNGYLPDGSVSSAALANGAVTSAKMAAGSVTSVKLASGLTLGGTTSGTFSGNLTGNASTATNATSFTGALAGDVTGTQSATSIAAATVTGKALTGFSSTTGTITASDTLLTAINKLTGNVALKAPIASPTFTGTVTVPANGLVVGTNQLVATGGEIGIGTSSPGRPLQVDGTSPAISIGSEFNGRTSLLMAVTAFSGGYSIIQSTSSAGGSYGALSLQPNGGDVGIGTETPTAKLDVNGGINFSGIISGNGSALTNLNGGNLAAGTVTAAKLGTDVGTWAASGGNAYRTTGNVGIGTASPEALLSLGSSVANSKLLLYDDGTFFYGMGIQNQQFRLHTSNSNDRFSFLNGPNGTENFTILGNGNVGIGTANPTHVLDVNGVSQSQGLELRRVGIPPYLDFSSNLVDDFNARIIWQGAPVNRLDFDAPKFSFRNGTTSLHILPGEVNGVASAGDVTLEIPGAQTLGIWDSLSVNNNLTVVGNSNIVGYAGVGYGGVISNCALTVKKAASSHVTASFLNQAGGTILQIGSSHVTASFLYETGTTVAQIGSSIDALYVNVATGYARRSDDSPFWSVASDRRLKTGVVPVTDALDTVSRLNPVRYHYTAERLAKMPGSVDKEHYGVIAQEYQKLFPQFVTTGADGYLSVQSDPLIFVATAAIKELNAKHDAAIAAKDAEIAALKKQLSSIDARLAALEQSTPGTRSKAVKVAMKK